MLDIVESIVVMATIFIILYLIILKKKADINDYFYYNIRNVIVIKVFIKRKAKNNSYFTNKRKMMKGWDNLPKEHTFKCETHDSMKKLIEKKENAGEVKIIKCKKCCRRTINLTSIEKKLRRKENFSGKVSRYKITFKTI